MKYANYAVNETKGRVYHEDSVPFRSDFARDRDRVVHSSAFRRLEYKTQVFINHEGDLFRTRLTHSIEVAQIGRSIASALNLNSDLVETICLAHDLGHTPFGHSGQDSLNSCMMRHGEHFEHNLQSLRIIEVLEKRYVEFDGLNLTFEAREGILKHCSLAHAKEMGELGQRFLNKTSPSLEAQLANVADEIAYNNHDIDDGLRSGLLKIEQFDEVTILREYLARIYAKYLNLGGRLLHKQLVRELINGVVGDVIESSLANIKNANVQSLEDVRHAPILVKYSDEMYAKQRELKKFLMKNMYRHHSVVQLRYKADKVINSLFNAFIERNELLPIEYQKNITTLGAPRVIADYISGMTDRYAFRLYNKLFTVDTV